MGNYFTNPVRHPEDVGTSFIRRRVTFSQSGIGTGTGVPIGALEKGSIPLRAYVIINTAFNAATTNVLTLGNQANSGAGQSLVIDSLVTSANAAAGTPGMKAGSGVALGTELPADTPFYALFTQTGTAATAGDATFVVEFVNARNWSDNVGGQAR